MAALPVESPGRAVSRSADVGYRAGGRGLGLLAAAADTCGHAAALWVPFQLLS